MGWWDEYCSPPTEWGMRVIHTSHLWGGIFLNIYLKGEIPEGRATGSMLRIVIVMSSGKTC